VAKDRKAPRSAGATGAGDRRAALVGVGKRGSLGQPSRRPLRPKGGFTPNCENQSQINSYNGQCVGFNHARCWSDERKYKIHERNVERKGFAGGGSRLSQSRRWKRISCTPCIELVQSELGHLACLSVLPVRGEQRGRLLADHDACYLPVPNWAG
jgi:hypothetical protein